MDIDGTLLNNEKQLTSETKEALLKAQDQGVLLVLASGRPYNGLVHLGNELKMNEHNGLFVCFNGSKVLNYQTGKTLFNNAISVEDAKALFDHLDQFPGCRPMVDKGEYMYVNNVFDNFINYSKGPAKFTHGDKFDVMQYESRGNAYKLCEVDHLGDWVSEPVNKVLTYGDPDYLQENYEAMYAPFKDKINAMFTAPFYYEFTAKGIDKTEAIKTALKPFDIKQEEIIAFGDAQNDKTMVMYAGVGVAMGNATDELKAVADYITDDNNSDGIAKALYKFLPEVYK